MPIQRPRYSIYGKNRLVFLYLIGNRNGKLFKFGVSKDPINRLKRLKYQKWGEYLGFPIATSEVLFISPPIPEPLAYQAEAKWLIENRGLAPIEYSCTREITTGYFNSIYPRYKAFCLLAAESTYYELEDPWLGSEFSLFNIFKYKRADMKNIRIYISTSYRPIIDIAKVYRSNPYLEHTCRFWGPFGFMANHLKSISKRTNMDRRYFIINHNTDSFIKHLYTYIDNCKSSVFLSNTRFDLNLNAPIIVKIDSNNSVL